MILCVDIGNTNIVHATWNNNIFSNIKRIETRKDNLLITNKNKITNIAISSVVPDLTDYYKNYFKKVCDINPFLVNHENCGITLDVNIPEEVGSDRICNAIGTKEKYRFPSIIIDFGSATTYDILDNNGNFIGGAIDPGIDVSAHYLIKKAALLDKVTFKFPSNVIGKNTENNLQSGIMYGGLDAVEGMIQRVKHEMSWKNNINIILTGGFSSLISPRMKTKHILDKTITLYGLKLILENQR